MGGSSKDGQVVGYKYYMSLLFGIGRPVDMIAGIKVGDLSAWDDVACDDSLQMINKPDLFGGEKKEGGIQGLFRFFPGRKNQVLPTTADKFKYGSLLGTSSTFLQLGAAIFFPQYRGVGTLPALKDSVGGKMGELRGRSTVWFDGYVAALNPYIKTWKFRVRRARKGWYNENAWYPEKAFIFLTGSDGKVGGVFAMNPAHILFQLCTDPTWGRGLPWSMLDLNSFTYGANLHCAEGLGLCMAWMRQDTLQAFAQTVLDHAGSVLYTDRETGKVTYKPIRADYNVADLPLFTPTSGLMAIDEDDSASTDSTYTEVVVTGYDPSTDEKIQARSHNSAARFAQGSTASLAKTYDGLPTIELCARTAQRDLEANASGLRRFKVTLDRRGFKLHPGAVFRISAPTRGIADMVLRAGEVDDGNMASGSITVSAVQDVFGLPLTTFVQPVTNTWTKPDGPPTPLEYTKADEANYRDVFLAQGASEAGTVGEGDSYLVTYGASSPVNVIGYDLTAGLDGASNWAGASEQFLTPTATITADLGYTDTTIVLENFLRWPGEELYQFEDATVKIGDEIMGIVSYDYDTNTMVVKRGAVDTWPTKHTAGDRLWLVDYAYGRCPSAFVEGETAHFYMATRTTRELQDADTLVEQTLLMGGRAAKPYPPANVQVSGQPFYSNTEHAEPVLTWAGRDRVNQQDKPTGFFEGSIDPEPGVTFTVRVYDKDGVTLLSTHDGVSSGYVYDNATQVADGTASKSYVYMEIVSVRDGIESWRPTRFKVMLRSGYGLGYGLNYGGA